MLAELGRFFLRFGIATFIASNLYIIVLNTYGIPVHPVLATMSSVFKAIGLASLISGAIYVFSNPLGRVLGGYFVPQLAQAAAYGVYISLFVGAVSSITTVIYMLVSMVPLPGGIVIGITGFASTIASASMLYYIATRISGLPAE